MGLFSVAFNFLPNVSRLTSHIFVTIFCLSVLLPLFLVDSIRPYCFTMFPTADFQISRYFHNEFSFTILCDTNIA